MSWNHRVVINDDTKEAKVYEVYYNTDGEPIGYCDAEACCNGDDPEDRFDEDTIKESLKKQLKQMKQATKLPFLHLPGDFYGDKK